MLSHWRQNNGEMSLLPWKKRLHSSPWGIIATQNLDNYYPLAVNAPLEGLYFFHLLNHLLVDYPLCIAGRAPGGTPVRRLANSQCQQKFLISEPLPQTLLVEFSSPQYPVSLGEFLTQGTGQISCIPALQSQLFLVCL